MRAHLALLGAVVAADVAGAQIPVRVREAANVIQQGHLKRDVDYRKKACRGIRRSSLRGLIRIA